MGKRVRDWQKTDSVPPVPKLMSELRPSICRSPEPPRRLNPSPRPSPTLPPLSFSSTGPGPSRSLPSCIDSSDRLPGERGWPRCHVPATGFPHLCPLFLVLLLLPLGGRQRGGWWSDGRSCTSSSPFGGRGQGEGEEAAQGRGEEVGADDRGVETPEVWHIKHGGGSLPCFPQRSCF